MSEGSSFHQVAVRRFRGDEAIGDSGRAVVDFWRWSSDLFENVQRGIFAEYVVATALDIYDQTRIGWTGYDLSYGVFKIEVKSSSYLQSWKQRALSRPIFQIGAREQWDEETGLFSDPKYVADVFVFCLFAHREPLTADILDLRQWRFFVLHTDTLKDRLPTSRSVAEDRLCGLTSWVAFESLRGRVDDVLREPRAFVKEGASAQESGSDLPDALYIYAVAQRGTRANPVIVTAADYKEAFRLARVDQAINSYGNDISAIRVSQPALQTLLRNGAKDLREPHPALASEH